MFKRSENIVHRLFERQIFRAAPNTHIHRVRQFYENIVPSFTVYDVECPDHYFRKFSNDGQYLICFSRSHQNLIVYRHKWLTFCIKGENSEIQDELPPKGRKFESYFSLLYSVNLASGNEWICKDFFLATECNCFGIFATATTPDNDPPATPGTVPGVPSIERITLYLVRLADGAILDERSFRNDFIHLTHNMGVFMYGDLLAVLSVRYQSIHILQVRETGMFVDVRTIGAYCREDDELILNAHAQVESMFQKEQEGLRKEKGFLTDTKLMESLDRQTKLPSLPLSSQGLSGRGQHDKWESSGGPSSGGNICNGGPLTSRSEGSQTVDIDSYDGSSRGLFSSEIMQTVAINPTAEEVRSMQSVCAIADDTSAEQDGDNVRGFSSIQERDFDQAQLGRNRHLTSAVTSGSAGYHLGMGIRAWYGLSYSNTSSESDSQSSGKQGHSLHRSSSSETASDSCYRGSSVSSGSITCGDSTLVGHYPSEGSVEYVVSSRVSAAAGVLSLSHRQPWHAEGPVLGGSLLRGRIDAQAQQAVSGSRHAHSIGVVGRALEHSGSSRTQNGHLLANFPSGHGRILSNQASASRSISIGDLHAAAADSTRRVTSSLRTNDDIGASRPGRAGPAGVGEGVGMGNPVERQVHAQGNIPRITSEAGQSSQGGQFLGGIKQRLLSFIFRSIWYQNTDPIIKAQLLKRFHYHFQHYVNLVMWKVQFLDRYHVLIKFGSADGVVSRNSETSHQTTFFAVYNLESTEMLGFYQNSSDELLHLYEQFCDHFRVASSYPLYMRFISSSSNNASVREQLREQKAVCNSSKSSGYSQVVKRILASLPYNSQSHSPSAYFDQSLFQFDEKLISATDRHRPCMEHPIKFISRRKPILKFKINPGHELSAGDGHVKRVVSFIFHPTFPFAISVQQSFMQPSVVNFHFRR